MPPARQPVQQLQVRQHDRLLPINAAGMRLRQPLNEFPIVRRKLLLLMRRPCRQLDDLPQRPHLLARAGAQQMELNRQTVTRRLLRIRLGPANRPQESAWRIEVRWFWREEPRLQLSDKLLLLRGLLPLGKAVEVGISAQHPNQWKEADLAPHPGLEPATLWSPDQNLRWPVENVARLHPSPPH